MNPQFVAETIHKLMDLFKRQDFPEVLAHTIIRRHPQDSVPSDCWSLANRILMVLAGTTDARGYRQWLDAGRYVRKGESSLKIIAPITRRGVADTETDDEPSRHLVGFCPIAVFAFESTDGDPLPTFHYEPPTPPPLWSVASKLGIRVTYAPFVGRYLGYFQPGTNNIVLNSQDSFVFFHEIAHAVHHSITPLRPGNLAREECVAEMSAALLCQIQGISGYEHSAYQYLSHYAETKDPTSVLAFLMGTLTDVEKVVTRILTVAAEDAVEEMPLPSDRSISA